MVRGFYTAASGAFVQQRSFNIISSNIANVTTAGYKGESAINSSFAEHLVARIGDGNIAQSGNIGPGSFFSANIDEYVNFSQGNMEETGRELDMGINGEGFFVIRVEGKGDLLTRNGQFDLDENGNLILPNGGNVLGTDGNPIVLSTSSFIVDDTGRIYEPGEGDEEDTEIGQLYVATVDDTSTLVNLGEGFFQNTTPIRQVGEKDYQVMQNRIEKANVNMASEMSKVIAGQNYFNACSQIIKIYDTLNQTLVNQVGKI